MTHHELCLIAAEWLHKKKNSFKLPTCKYVAVEVNSVGNGCTADVFGWGDGIGIGWAGVQIEVKMSHSDFLRDKKKKSNDDPSFDVGYIKYYCCPEGVISESEINEDFGLLWLVDNEIVVKKEASCRKDKSPSREVPLIASVMRRLKVKEGIFDFKNRKDGE